MTLFLNDGRWVAYCGTPGCAGAERLWPDGKTHRKRSVDHPFGVTTGGVLHCGNCGQTTPVEMPPEMAAVDALMNQRPVPQTRNWTPGETLDGLKAENLSHGAKI